MLLTICFSYEDSYRNSLGRINRKTAIMAGRRTKERGDFVGARAIAPGAERMAGLPAVVMLRWIEPLRGTVGRYRNNTPGWVIHGIGEGKG